MDVTVSVLTDVPDLADELWAMEDAWPEFMTRDPIAAMFYRPDVIAQFSDYALVCRDQTGNVIGKAYSMPFYLEDRRQLPVDGWDGVVRRGLTSALSGPAPNAVSALEIAIAPEHLGRGLSSRLLKALRDNARRLGFDELLAPVRPNGLEDPSEPMDVYAARVRDDDLPHDPWLRVHVRAGGRIDGVAPRSMVIPGTLAEWRRWTGLPFDRSGQVVVPQALTPVLCDVHSDIAVYVEPNVWVRHPTQ